MAGRVKKSKNAVHNSWLKCVNMGWDGLIHVIHADVRDGINV